MIRLLDAMSGERSTGVWKRSSMSACAVRQVPEKEQVKFLPAAAAARTYAEERACTMLSFNMYSWVRVSKCTGCAHQQPGRWRC